MRNTFAGSNEAYKALRTVYRATSMGQTIYMEPDEVSLLTLYELSNLGLISMDTRSPRRVQITDYGRRVYFMVDTPEGCKE